MRVRGNVHVLVLTLWQMFVCVGPSQLLTIRFSLRVVSAYALSPT